MPASPVYAPKKVTQLTKPIDRSGENQSDTQPFSVRLKSLKTLVYRRKNRIFNYCDLIVPEFQEPYRSTKCATCAVCNQTELSY